MLRELGFIGIWRINPAIISVLLFFSILMLGAFLERFFFYMVYGRWNESFWQRVRKMSKERKLHEAFGMCTQVNNAFSRVFATAINASALQRTDAEDMVQSEKETQLELLRKRSGIFSTLSFISPLIGLLGTVMGIMQAFNDLGRAGSGGANIVAAGISEALVTTAAGIVVAVPAAIIYNYFNYRLRSVNVMMNNRASDLLIILFEGKQ